MSSLVNVAPAGVWQSFRGLHLRTHPDADVAASKVMLVHADEIVMHDGVRVADWDRLVADIASAGAGGLDTGSEVASTWYEVHAIRKSSDGTKNLLLHRAKDYFLDQSQTIANTDDNLRIATGTTSDKLAQGFQVATAGSMPFADIKLTRSAAMPANSSIWLTIEADSAGNPSGTPLATSDKLDASLLGTTGMWVRFVFRNPVSLSTSTQYHLVLQGDYTRSDTAVAEWHGDTANSYANGSAKRYNGTTWSAAAFVVDFAFKVSITRNDAAVTMPSGYDQRAQVGWVYNNASSNFSEFRALDRFVKLKTYQAIVSAGTGVIPTLVDVGAAVPPVAVQAVELQLYGSAAGNIYVTSAIAGTSWQEYGFRYTTAAAVDVTTVLSLLAIEMQALYYTVETMANGTILIGGWRW